MKQITYYHEKLITSLDNISKLRERLSPIVREYKSSFSKGEVDTKKVKNMQKYFDSLEKEVIYAKKLIDNICDECKDIYEEMV